MHRQCAVHALGVHNPVDREEPGEEDRPHPLRALQGDYPVLRGELPGVQVVLGDRRQNSGEQQDLRVPALPLPDQLRRHRLPGHPLRADHQDQQRRP